MTPRFSINQLMTPRNSVWDDIPQFVAAGATGITITEDKLKDPTGDGRVARQIRNAGLEVTYCVPSIWPLLPSQFDTPDTPVDLGARIDSICRSIQRFAAFKPMGVVVGGAIGDDPLALTGRVEDILAATAVIADVAAEHDMRVGFELLPASSGAPLHTFIGAVNALDLIGRSNVGLVVDVIASWSEPGVHNDLRRFIDRIDYVHLNDVRDPQRSWADRLLPGDGLDRATPFIAALLDAGYNGWWEIEIFSDDGRFGNDFPDSLWKMPHSELVRLGIDAARECHDRAAKSIHTDNAKYD